MLRDTISIIERHVSNATHPVIAFSAGKDSIVVAHILVKHFGISSAVCDNSFWFDNHTEDARTVATQIGLNVNYVDRFGDDYLLSHPKWLFPPEKEQSSIYAARQQKTVKGYAKKNKCDVVIYGRRSQENTVKDYFYHTADGLYHLQPLKDWKHEDIWKYIRDNNIYVPRIYSHAIGQNDGSTPYNLISPEKYDKRPADLILDFCPSTYNRLIQKGIIHE
jgi:3'-phosphoadenosine 5'-phosphosulfate sulfotransferase (PAPS reductase)/FAD synthetase